MEGEGGLLQLGTVGNDGHDEGVEEVVEEMVTDRGREGACL